MIGEDKVAISPEVEAAVASGGAVVALESTLIAHGLPAPENLRVAEAAEAAVRAEGAVPATVAVLGGRAVVGVDAAGLRRLAGSGGVAKAGRRDLGAVAARGLDAATTVSATLHLARRAGLGVFATGGLGGVHRGAGASFDVSSDLDELARADGVLVVCSGAKSILDLPATLEALETRGVPIVGYRTGELPAFTAASSGLPLEWRADDPAGAAALVRAHRALGVPGALVLAQPAPADVALDHEASDAALAEALAQAEARGVSGKALTPFLLDAMRRATGGRSLAANAALIVAKARLAARVAVALATG
jgi:pseudouridine-5'-phosphate glycosidase